MSLIKITAPPAEITGKYNPHPEAKALLLPTHTPTQYAAVLQKGSFSQDHIHFLAHGMPERNWWDGHGQVPPRCRINWSRRTRRLWRRRRPGSRIRRRPIKREQPRRRKQISRGRAPGRPRARLGQKLRASRRAQGTESYRPRGGGFGDAGGRHLRAQTTGRCSPRASPKTRRAESSHISSPQTGDAQDSNSCSSTSANAAARTAAAKIHQPFIDMGHGIASGKESFI